MDLPFAEGEQDVKWEWEWEWETARGALLGRYIHVG
jgi:hypothetical protein